MKGKSPQTVANYRSIADHHLIPFIGAANLKKLTADELDTWLDDRAEELSTRTLRLVHQILERAIRHAQARDKVRRNVASLVIPPEGQEGRPSRAMTLDQAISVLDQAGPGSPHRLAAYVVVSLLAGIRTEEARALVWAEVDLDAGTVAVYRSVGDTKTRKSRRVLKLPERGRRITQGASHPPGRRAASRGRRMAGPRPGVLPRGRHAIGPLAGPPRIRRHHQGRRPGRGVGPRELRHSFVSILSAHGVRIEDISDLVGHSGTTVTETVYRHEIRPALTTGATAMNKILAKERPRLPAGEPVTPRLPTTPPSAAQPATRRATPAKPRPRRRA